MDLKLGVAVSQDGANWSRLEGEHPSGACLDVGAAGDFDATFVGWPQVVPLPEQDKFRLYYHALDRESGNVPPPLSVLRFPYQVLSSGVDLLSCVSSLGTSTTGVNHQPWTTGPRGTPPRPRGLDPTAPC